MADNEEAKQEVEEAIEDIEKFMESLGDLLSALIGKKELFVIGKKKRMMPSLNYSQTFILTSSKITEIISKIVYISFTISLFRFEYRHT